MTNEELCSKTISFLRFPLCVGVVFIHNNMGGAVNIQGQKFYYNSWPWVTYIMDFFSAVLPAISVPLFFFFSGFLFFYNCDFNKTIYYKKIKSRYHTLFIPYLFWNFLGFLLLLIRLHPRFLPLFPLLSDYKIDITKFLGYFWAHDLPIWGEKWTSPIDAPLWFIRDLMVQVIIAPITYWLLKKTKLLIILIIGILWISNLWGLTYPKISSILFFQLGAYFSIYHINFVETAHRVKWAPYAYFILALGDMLSKGHSINPQIHCCGILAGLIAAIYIASKIIENGKIKNSKFLSDASFFIFAIHGLFISIFMKGTIIVVQPSSPYQVLLIYFLVPIITIFISLVLYKFLYRYMPYATKVITGGR